MKKGCYDVVPLGGGEGWSFLGGAGSLRSNQARTLTACLTQAGRPQRRSIFLTFRNSFTSSAILASGSKFLLMTIVLLGGVICSFISVMIPIKPTPPARPLPSGLSRALVRTVPEASTQVNSRAMSPCQSTAQHSTADIYMLG